MGKITAWTYLSRCIDRAALETKDFWGLDVKTVITFVILFALGILLQWRVRGVSETKDDFAKWIVTVAMPFVLFFVFLVLFNLARAPYLILTEEAAAAGKRIEAAEHERDDAKIRAKGLEVIIGEKDEAIVRQSKLIGLRHAADPTYVPARREVQQDEEQKHRLAVRTELGRLLNALTGIKDECLAKPADFPCEKMSNEWTRETRNFIIEKLEPSYLARFDAATGNWMSYNAVVGNPKINGIVNYLTFKAAILEKFLEEFR